MSRRVPAIAPHLLSDPVARAWLAVFEPGHPARGWDHGDVDHLLKEAFTTLRRIGGRVGPARGSGYWPMVVRQLEPDEVLREAAGPRRQAPAETVSRVEATLDWLRVGRDPYLPPDTPERDALMLWCWCAERGEPYARVLREIGASKPTQDRRRRRASMMIAARLIRDAVPIPLAALVERGRRAEPAMHAETAPPPALPGSEPELAAFWGLVEALARDPDPVAAADGVLDAIFSRVRWEHRGEGFGPAAIAELETRRRYLQTAAVSRRLLDPFARAAARRGRTASGRLPYAYRAGAASVQVAQDGGWYGPDSTWRTLVYRYAVEGPAADVEAAVAALRAEFPPAAFRTSFGEPAPVGDGAVRVEGWRAAMPDPE